MKSLILAAALTATMATAASAALPTPISEVSVSIGPELQAKANKYGQKDLDMLARDLKRDVERALARSGSAGPGGASLQLVLVDAVPNRPTFKQLGDHVGLSYDSFGVGGAAIEGAIVYPDGRRQPVRYKWYETDIRQTPNLWTWTDAAWTFEQFADRLAAGKAYAER
ncbi:MAG TPA: hypothetical protein VFE03_00525 [Caulobacteraceae bacterium]|jgi:hypothetical protein|nr:hypothetical protein [Caulobacteraceae bacterium]